MYELKGYLKILNLFGNLNFNYLIGTNFGVNLIWVDGQVSNLNRRAKTQPNRQIKFPPKLVPIRYVISEADLSKEI